MFLHLTFAAVHLRCSLNDSVLGHSQVCWVGGVVDLVSTQSDVQLFGGICVWFVEVPAWS